MIGVFDSGVGGLSLVRELFLKLPEFQVVYFGDTARVPYGTKGEEVIKRYAKEDVDFLISQGAKIIIIACHTVSSVASDYLRKTFPKIPIFEVVTPGIEEAYQKSARQRIGVIGTSATVRSGLHKKLLQSIGQCEVIEKECPLFVPLVEESFVNRPETIKIARYYLRELKLKKIDTLILACTHYPFLKSVIKKVMGNQVRLIDPAVSAVNKLAEYLAANPEISNSLLKNNNHQFFASDIPAKFAQISKKLFGKEIKIERVKMEIELTAKKYV
ncbi:MAG: hypothetical protein ACD_68C00096G0001 [uncultured bacterium]|nr:MAG: hypothetical protein ACD_68C00096G0001 [uncultured bacterium]